MTADAGKLFCAKLLVQVAPLARHKSVQTEQRKAGNVVIECHVFFPVGRIVTRGAILTQLSFMSVGQFVASEAGR